MAHPLASVAAPVLAPAQGVARPDLTWLQLVQAQIEASLAELFELPDEACLDSRWKQAMVRTRAYALRPAKRLRPVLVVAGYHLTRGGAGVPPGLWQFAAGLELLHTFLLIHDDVADRADLRRGGAALHHLLAPGRAGEDLAVVVGDHLFARAMEAMLGSGLRGAAKACQYYLAVCRHTAAGQYLDLDLSRAALADVGLFQALRVAHLKTARYGFCAPLVCGAILAEADEALCQGLERVGRYGGLAYQLRDDVLGLFGDARMSGKAGDSDFSQGKRTFPVLAAYARASTEGRAELERLWALPAQEKDEAALGHARELVERWGGRLACERMVERSSRAALRALRALPEGGGMREVLGNLITRLAHRAA
ncbi:polyprenyl synthetase family protein [Stigmatella aurantiaca]|nr:polyprenyl synthetase family protein [Stigmatella aurantiaca]ADO74837.1 Geranylgeranyl pyrophosphate synthetase [Stigmatella aurantiaca DW4/3-1]